MTLKVNVPNPILLKPKISVFGIGGAGGNAVNNMIRSNLEGVDFVVANTDAQALSDSLAADRIQLGADLTKGLGAGSFPDKGREAAEENIEDIQKYLEGNNMIFITAGMGGGTGTGAAPVIAKLAKEQDILSVGVVTKPFDFEGRYRLDAAESGIEELKKYVDTLIVIPNQNLFRIANEQTTFESAFKMADNVLHAGVRGITDLITMPGLVNLDFADIKAIMSKMGKAMMGTGEAEGDNRAVTACQSAISNPLLDDVSIHGARGVLVNMTGGPDMTLFEADLAVNTIRKEVDENANIIFGSAFNDDMAGKIRISVVATGIESELEASQANVKTSAKANEVQTDLLIPSTLSSKNNRKPTGGFDQSSIQSIDEDLQKINESNFKSEALFNENFSTEDDQNPEDTIAIKENNKNEIDGHDIYNEDDQQEKPAVKPNINSDDLFSDEDKFNKALENLAISDNNQAEKPAAKKPKKAAANKKESGSFSLFSFMNYKNKSSQIDDQPEEELPFDLQNKPTEPKNENQAPKSENDQDYKPKPDDQNEELNLEDDILNIPAFFRRNK